MSEKKAVSEADTMPEAMSRSRVSRRMNHVPTSGMVTVTWLAMSVQKREYESESKTDELVKQ